MTQKQRINLLYKAIKRLSSKKQSSSSGGQADWFIVYVDGPTIRYFLQDVNINNVAKWGTSKSKAMRFTTEYGADTFIDSMLRSRGNVKSYNDANE